MNIKNNSIQIREMDCEKTPSCVVAFDISMNSTGVSVKFGSDVHSAIIGNDLRKTATCFDSFQYKRLEEGAHDTVLKHQSAWNQIIVVDTYVNTILAKYGLHKNCVDEVRIESLAMTKLGQSSRIIDLTIFVSNYITYITQNYEESDLHLVSAQTIKKAQLGVRKRRPKGAPKVDEKKKMLETFEKEYDADLSQGKNDDAVDSFVLATKVVI